MGTALDLRTATAGRLTLRAMRDAQRVRMRRGARHVAERVVGATGYDLVRKHYYSPIPDLTQLPQDVWSQRVELPGVRFDIDEGLEFVRRELADYVVEYRPPAQQTSDPRRFYLNNGLYGTTDAETLYAMVRRWAPKRIVELGSGMSTLVMADARAASGLSPDGRHRVFDPYPRDDLAPVLRQVADLQAVGATAVPETEFDALQEGDLLFVDTTHTVKIGGDVNRIILQVLPRLAPGVIVHVHDIYLPWEYPREYMSERRFFWAEQYLLQAFLAFNPSFEILFGAHALERTHPTEMRKLIPGPRYGTASALWLRRVSDLRTTANDVGSLSRAVAGKGSH
jgi:hypothetical protein